MCTVTIVPVEDGFRLACNRDERRSRPEAVPPRVRSPQEKSAIFPVDPASGGTWVGVNHAGLAATLLNRTARAVEPGRRAACSRGLIVPRLLAHEWIGHALDAAEAIDASSFEPFRLVLIHGFTVGLVASDGHRLATTISRMRVPLLFTSSSLGDALVEEPRRRLFEQLVVEDKGAWLRAQFRFHRHQWPARTDISVSMERSDARTVSRTVIDVGSQAIELGYEPVGSAAPLAVRVA